MESYAAFVPQVGLELEGFVLEGGGAPVAVAKHVEALTERTLPYGEVTYDAGVNQLELITPPHASSDDAIDALEVMTSRLPKDWHVYFQARSPCFDHHREPAWSHDFRFGAILEALAREKPVAWSGVKQMANWSALHVNVDVDPRSHAGMLVMNVINNVGPYIASRTRLRFPGSEGHLALWSGWGREGRLPHYGEWYVNWDAYCESFSKLPRLVKSSEGSVLIVDLLTPRNVEDDLDLGTNWKLCRPKRNRISGKWYIEIRVLPSMPLVDSMRHFVRELVQGVGSIVSLACELDDRVFATVGDAWMFFPHAYRASPRLFPEKALTKREWNRFFLQ